MGGQSPLTFLVSHLDPAARRVFLFRGPMNLKLRLVDDAARVHTYSSTIIAAGLGAISAASPFIEAAWTGMPEEVKSLLPDSWRLAIAIAVGCLAIIAARYTTTAPKTTTSETVDGDTSAAAK